MKIAILVLPMLFLSFSVSQPEYAFVEIEYLDKMVVREIKTSKIINAIIFVESSGNDSAYCKAEDAVGCLQIRRTMVNDVNRILKTRGKDDRYSFSDRWDRSKSIDMFNIYTSHYGLETSEDIARAWNGGPRGSRKNATIKYWDKVQKELDQN